MIGATQDITDIRRVEPGHADPAAHAKSPEGGIETEVKRLAAIVESSPDAIVGIDFDGTITSWNESATRFSGRTAAEVIGKSIFSIHAPSLEADMQAMIARIRQGEMIQMPDLVLAKPAENSRTVAVTLRPVKSRTGALLGIAAVAHDVTERRQAEDALAASEERLRLALDATSDGIWDWNIPTGEVHFSDQWLRSLGYDRSEVPPSVIFWQSIIHPDDWPKVEAALQAHFAGDTPVYECENRLRMKTGEYRHNLDRGRSSSGMRTADRSAWSGSMPTSRSGNRQRLSEHDWPQLSSLQMMPLSAKT
ncbi:MAG: PAS domain S-box protein [Anaerolineales bacterium]|nr:PAS domain S-box protein [Anaerolineales bacterium]